MKNGSSNQIIDDANPKIVKQITWELDALLDSTGDGLFRRLGLKNF